MNKNKKGGRGGGGEVAFCVGDVRAACAAVGVRVRLGLDGKK